MWKEKIYQLSSDGNFGSSCVAGGCLFYARRTVFWLPNITQILSCRNSEENGFLEN